MRLSVCAIFCLRSTNKLSAAVKFQDDAVKNRSDIDQESIVTAIVTAIVTIVPSLSEPFQVSLHLSLSSVLFRDGQWDTQDLRFCFFGQRVRTLFVNVVLCPSS